MKWLSRVFIGLGLVFMGYSGYHLYEAFTNERATLEAAHTYISEQQDVYASEPAFDVMSYDVEYMETVGVLTIPSLDNRAIGIVEGADEDALAHGVGRVESTAFPGQGEQIVLSGHRDSVFRNFDRLDLGDTFIVDMPYGTFEYEIREIDIVDADDTTVIGPMGEEVLVVSTCYPFGFIGPAPQRAVFYAYPVN